MSGSSSSVSRPFNVIVVGGSSGMGKAAALATVQRGGRVLLVARSKEIIAEVPTAQISTASVDVTDEKAVEKFASTLLPSLPSKSGTDIHKNGSSNEHTNDHGWDGLVVSAAGKAPHGPVASLPISDTRQLMESKLWSAYHCAKYIGPKLQNGGCMVMVAGILNRRPGLNCAPLSMANGALEGLTRTLALEWGPKLRVNCLSPGFCDTERFDHMDSERKKKMLINTASSLPLQRVGQPSDMGEAIYYLLTAPFCTGVILDVDGGHGIRQYANPSNDPMRSKK